MHRIVGKNVVNEVDASAYISTLMGAAVVADLIERRNGAC